MVTSNNTDVVSLVPEVQNQGVGRAAVAPQNPSLLFSMSGGCRVPWLVAPSSPDFLFVGGYVLRETALK